MIEHINTAKHNAQHDRAVRRRFCRTVGLASCAALILLCSGCLAVAVGAGAAGGAAGTVYVMGKLEDELNHPMPAVRAATLAALKDLGLPVRQDKEDKLTALLESEFADTKHVWINLESVADSRTKIMIRVDALGDEARSRKILDAIKKHLP